MSVKSFLAASAAALFMVAPGASAQDNSFNAGDLGINVNVGFGSFVDNDFDGYGWNDNVFQTSVGGSVEYGIMDGLINGKGSIGVGGQFGLGFGSEKYAGDKTNFTRIRIATRGVFHYQFIPQLDTYAGITFGIVDINKAKYKPADSSMPDLSFTETNFIVPVAFAGVRYMLSDSFGFNSEVSWDRFAFFSIGVTFKI